jgi:hypothetical protein
VILSLVQATAVPADSLRRVLDSVFAQPQYRWARPSPFAILGRWWRALLEWLQGLEATQPWLYWFLFFAMLAVLAAILLHAVIVMGRTLKAAHRLSEQAAVPVARARGAAWYRAEAVRLAAAGRYPEAMQHDFLGLVLELDQRRVLRYHPSKTPGEYSHELKLSEPDRGAFRALVQALYRFAFARIPCGPADFERWHQQASTERYATAH